MVGADQCQRRSTFLELILFAQLQRECLCKSHQLLLYTEHQRLSVECIAPAQAAYSDLTNTDNLRRVRSVVEKIARAPAVSDTPGSGVESVIPAPSLCAAPVVVVIIAPALAVSFCRFGSGRGVQVDSVYALRRLVASVQLATVSVPTVPSATVPLTTLASPSTVGRPSLWPVLLGAHGWICLLRSSSSDPS